MLQDLRQLCPVPCVPERPPNVSISAGQTRPARVPPHIWSFLGLPGALHYSSFEVFLLADWISEGQSSAAAARFAVIFAEDSLLWDSFPPSCSQSLQETDSSLPLSLRWKWLIQLLLDFFFFFLIVSFSACVHCLVSASWSPTTSIYQQTRWPHGINTSSPVAQEEHLPHTAVFTSQWVHRQLR